jgi:ElaB/YqjD/DUF883 family membrane-anchored ribosome-binding protein
MDAMEKTTDKTVAEVTAISGDVKIPDEVTQEITALAAVAAHGLSITTDDELREAESVRMRAKKVIAAIESIYSDEKAKRYAAHRAIVGEEKFVLARPNQIVALCENAMKPYLVRREQEREAERLRLEAVARREAEERRAQEAEAARIETERLAAITRREAEERAQREREEAERQAAAIEEEALKEYERLAAAGKAEEADEVLQNAQQRSANITEEAEQVATTIVGEGEELAQRTEADGATIIQEIASMPVERMHIAAPAAPQMDSTGTSSTYKVDRVEAVKPQNKLQMLRYIIEQSEHGNFDPLSWVEHVFKHIDSAAKRMAQMFPPEEKSGLRVGKDIGLRSKPTPKG